MTDQYLDQLMDLCQPGDLFVDGANSKWKDTMVRAERAKARGFEFVDCGTSGGIWGLTEGYSIMAGGSPKPSRASSRWSRRSPPPTGTA